MNENNAAKVKVVHEGSLGVLWFAGWLFSIGYLKLSFWKGALALVLWPYFLGAHFAPIWPRAETTPAVLDELKSSPAEFEPKPEEQWFEYEARRFYEMLEASAGAHTTRSQIAEIRGWLDQGAPAENWEEFARSIQNFAPGLEPDRRAAVLVKQLRQDILAPGSNAREVLSDSDIKLIESSAARFTDPEEAIYEMIRIVERAASRNIMQADMAGQWLHQYGAFHEPNLYGMRFDKSIQWMYEYEGENFDWVPLLGFRWSDPNGNKTWAYVGGDPREKTGWVEIR